MNRKLLISVVSAVLVLYACTASAGKNERKYKRHGLKQLTEDVRRLRHRVVELEGLIDGVSVAGLKELNKLAARVEENESVIRALETQGTVLTGRINGLDSLVVGVYELLDDTTVREYHVFTSHPGSVGPYFLQCTEGRMVHYGWASSNSTLTVRDVMPQTIAYPGTGNNEPDGIRFDVLNTSGNIESFAVNIWCRR